LNIAPPAGITPGRQKANLDFLKQLEVTQAERHPENTELSSRLESDELAFRMQSEMPDVLAKESKETLSIYGVGDRDKDIDSLGRRGLLARWLGASVV